MRQPRRGEHPHERRGRARRNGARPTRDRRRAARRAKFVALWGDLIEQPPALAELQLHGWRMARLRRLGRLAAVSNKPALGERITRLEAKEEARHVRQLNRLKHPAAPPSGAPQPRRLPPLPQGAAPARTEASELDELPRSGGSAPVRGLS